MRRRWKALVAVGAVVLVGIVALVSVAPGADDGLDWIRKYGPVESSFEIKPAPAKYVGIKTRRMRHEFRFPNGIPSELNQEIDARLEAEIADMDKGIYNHDLPLIDVLPGNLVVAERLANRPWLEIQWRSLRRTVGIDSNYQE
jgi:hypothetical protein